MSGSEEEGNGGLFEEPDDYYEEEDTTFRTSTYARKGTDDQLTIRLVPTHVLWGHLLWNASIRLADHFDAHPELVQDKRGVSLMR